jgi:NAD(P)-dependent dehydrogenase (short-subunit alcohol dehydrogenase family)
VDERAGRRRDPAHLVHVGARGGQPARVRRCKSRAHQPLEDARSRAGRRRDSREHDRARLEFPGGLWEQIRHGNRPFYDAIKASIPWGRLGTAEEVANAIVFAASPRASWITGVVLSIDGGQHKGNL